VSGKGLKSPRAASTQASLTITGQLETMDCSACAVPARRKRVRGVPRKSKVEVAAALSGVSGVPSFASYGGINLNIEKKPEGARKLNIAIAPSLPSDGEDEDPELSSISYTDKEEGELADPITVKTETSLANPSNPTQSNPIGGMEGGREIERPDQEASRRAPSQTELEEALSSRGLRLGPQLGRGSSGTVFTAFGTRDGPSPATATAVKIFNEGVCEKEFRDEVNVLYALTTRATRPHPNIVAYGCYVIVRELHVRALVMELMGGGTVESLIRAERSSLPGAVAVNLFGQVVSGLLFIHSCRFLHCDLKPANVLLSADKSTAKIADMSHVMLGYEVFNVNVRSLDFTNIRGHPLCSLWYRCPEAILSGKSVRTVYTTAVDVFSAGAVFAELLDGFPAFCRCTADNCEVGVLMNILRAAGTPVSTSTLEGLPYYSDLFPRFPKPRMPFGSEKVAAKLRAAGLPLAAAAELALSIAAAPECRPTCAALNALILRCRQQLPTTAGAAVE
jgi:serine/threonine protein kinase